MPAKIADLLIIAGWLPEIATAFNPFSLRRHYFYFADQVGWRGGLHSVV